MPLDHSVLVLELLEGDQLLRARPAGRGDRARREGELLRSCTSVPVTCASMCVSSAYDAMLNGMPSPGSAERWYMRHYRRGWRPSGGSCTQN